MMNNLIRFYSMVIFPQILEMTVIASIVILAVILIRFLIRRSPKVFSYLLWSVVLFRLLCPVSFSTNMSMFNLKLFRMPMLHEVHNVAALSENFGNIPDENLSKGNVPNIIPDAGTITSILEKTTDHSKTTAIITVAAAIWFAGMLLLFAANFISFLKVKQKAEACLRIRDNIYIADEIDTPFCLGLVHPKIYLPSSLEEEEMEYIILHEQTHIRRMDHIVKMLAFAALMVHWFNPLVWLAFNLACKDIEMSCDEAVMRKMKGDIRQEYCMSILQLATRKRFSLVAPLAFADGDPKRRIKNVMKYKKPRTGMLVLSMLICIISTIGLSSNAETKVDHEVISSTSESDTNSSNEATDDTTTDIAVQETAAEEEVPFQEITDESVINKYLHGFTLPEDLNLSDVKYYLYDDSDLLEIHFVYENHTDLIARIVEADSYEDISGADYPWTFETDELTLSDRPAHTTSYFTDTESVMLITWFEADAGVNVSLEALGKDLDGFDLFAVAERMLPEN